MQSKDSYAFSLLCRKHLSHRYKYHSGVCVIAGIAIQTSRKMVLIIHISDMYTELLHSYRGCIYCPVVSLLFSFLTIRIGCAEWTIVSLAFPKARKDTLNVYACTKRKIHRSIYRAATIAGPCRAFSLTAVEFDRLIQGTGKALQMECFKAPFCLEKLRKHRHHCYRSDCTQNIRF